MAIIKRGNATREQIATLAMELYQSQRTALGIVSLQWAERYNGERRFDYETFRSPDPDPYEVRDFVDENWNDTLRFILHGRLATSGERDNEGTHPIPIDCPECDIDYVLHNGVIGRVQNEKSWSEKNGHEWSTSVDSELIAHEFGRIPGTVDELVDTVKDSFLRYQPAFVLLNDKYMFVHAREGGKYSLTDSGELLCSRRQHEVDADIEHDDIANFLLRAEPAQTEEVTA